MDIIINLSSYNVTGAWFTIKGVRLRATGYRARVTELLNLLKTKDGFSAAKSVIVPLDDPCFWTFFLSAWVKEFESKGKLALHISSNGGPVHTLGDLTAISELFD